ncbi:MAG: cystathionine beta-synthase [Anaerolineales bacterium]|jgi:cystathionine beta-synthase
MKFADDVTKRRFESLERAIGHTPLVRLNHVTSDIKPAIYAKLEMLNPGGSVKDRIGISIIEAYEASGELKPGGTVVEATSGNTGVGLAMICAMRGYKSVFVMPDKMSQEKIDTLRAFGSRVVVTPTAVEPDDPRSYYSVARQIVEDTPGAILANQYHNPANPQSHYETTAPEIWDQTNGKVTDIVVGMGTGGTITGLARYFRDHGHQVNIVGVDPEGSILYDAWNQDGRTTGLAADTYLVEGIGEDFIPGTLDLSLVDHVVQVGDAESFYWTRRVVREEGIFCGGSCGSALAGAIKYAQNLDEDRLLVVIFPDSGARYLSKIFDDDWMREHGMLKEEHSSVSVLDVAGGVGMSELILAKPEDRVVDVIKRMREDAISQLPVVDEQRSLLGVVSEVDLLNHMLNVDHKHQPDETIETMVNKDVAKINSNQPFDAVLPDLMQSKMVILTDDDGRPEGILTMIDALEYVIRRELN